MNTADPKPPKFKAPKSPRAGFTGTNPVNPTIKNQAKFVKKVSVPASASAYKGGK